MNIEKLSKLWEASSKNPKLKQSIEGELQQQIQSNTSFCIEDIFDLLNLKNKALSIYFIPSSNAYKQYGSFVTALSMNINPDSVEQLLKNIADKKHTYGNLNCTVLSAITERVDIEFNTSDIYEVTFR